VKNGVLWQLMGANMVDEHNDRFNIIDDGAVYWRW
jgi:hypothetical protein